MTVVIDASTCVAALSSHDAWYVALAEALAVPLATLDERLVNATGPECEFVTPQL